MRILMLGVETQVLDEGAKNVATNLARVLNRDHPVMVVHQREALAPRNIRRARGFRPDVILSVHGPSARTVALMSVLRGLCGSPWCAMIGTQPHTGGALRLGLKLMPPDRIFAQSRVWQERFDAAGVKTLMLPNGVDMQKFQPCEDPERIRAMRADLGIGADQRVALHVGPINSNRNHELLIRLQRETSWQVVVVGSTSETCLPHLVSALRSAGAQVHLRYFPQINLVYSAADVYVFPVEDRTGSIEFPLTVLEAMACDRPVVTTAFRGIPDFLDPDKALRFFNDFGGLVDGLDAVYGMRGNRERVRAFDWESIASRLLAGVAESVGVRA